MEKVAYAETVSVLLRAGNIYDAVRVMSIAKNQGFWGTAPAHYNVGLTFLYQYRNQLLPY